MNRVINIKSKEAKAALASNDPGYVYCGRKNLRYGVEESPYHNPFRLSRESERIDVIRQFRKYWYASEQIALREQAQRELPGKTLVCWCAPLSCHCDVIARFLTGEQPKTDIDYENMAKNIANALMLQTINAASIAALYAPHSVLAAQIPNLDKCNELFSLLHGSDYESECGVYGQNFEEIRESFVSLLIEIKQVPKQGFVYLASRSSGLYKIGRSTNLKDRELALVREHKGFSMLHTIPCDDFVRSEFRLHDRFKAKRIEGEWFDLSERDVRFLKRIKRL